MTHYHYISKTKRQNAYQIVEFSYGFAVLCNGKRIGLCLTEDDAERIIRRAKRGR